MQEVPKRHDPVDLWNRASTGVKESFIGYPSRAPLDAKLPIAKKLLGERSPVWTSLSQLTPSDQVTFMKKLLRNWPFRKERWAISSSLHAGVIANSITSTIIATRISAEVVLMDSKMLFLDAIRACPKSPFVMAVYASGMAYFGMHTVLVQKLLLREGKLCPTCMLTRNVITALMTGIALPMLTTPYLSYYVLLQRGEKYPMVKSYIEFLTLSWLGSRVNAPIMPQLLFFQIAVAAISTYFMLWGRNKIFTTIDVDPEMVKDIMVNAQAKSSAKKWLEKKLSKTPFWGRLVEDPTEDV